VDYRCAECGDEEVIEISAFGSDTIWRTCAACGSDKIHKFDGSVKYKRTQPPSVGQMLHRLRRAENTLPPTPMEQAILARKHVEARDDLVDLLAELG